MKHIFYALIGGLLALALLMTICYMHLALTGKLLDFSP